jgi:hypothetical protein
MANPALMSEFTAISGEAELFRKTIELGHAHGVELTEAQLTEIARANRRAWLERWLPL